jgi:serine/threonine-protein kinase TTK/MPS1
VFREQGLIYMVLEYGDIDLARLLHNHHEELAARRNERNSFAPSSSSSAAVGGQGGGGGRGGGEEPPLLDENFVRLHWQQMLKAVRGIHELKIVHSDLKPANFLIVQVSMPSSACRAPSHNQPA